MIAATGKGLDVKGPQVDCRGGSCATTDRMAGKAAQPSPDKNRAKYLYKLEQAVTNILKLGANPKAISENQDAIRLGSMSLYSHAEPKDILLVVNRLHASCRLFNLTKEQAVQRLADLTGSKSLRDAGIAKVQHETTKASEVSRTAQKLLAQKVCC